MLLDVQSFPFHCAHINGKNHIDPICRAVSHGTCNLCIYLHSGIANEPWICAPLFTIFLNLCELDSHIYRVVCTDSLFFSGYKTFLATYNYLDIQRRIYAQERPKATTHYMYWRL